MTPLQLAGWLRQCYLQRDIDGFERGLGLLQRATTHPDARITPTLNRDQLQERRGELLSELAAVQDALARIERVRAGEHATAVPAPCSSLEGTDDG